MSGSVWQKLLHHILQYGVICCLEEKYSLLHKNISLHLKEFHNMTKRDREACAAWMLQLSPLHSNPSLIPYSLSPIELFSCLGNVIIGYGCDKCPYLRVTTSEDPMRRHYRNSHQHVYHQSQPIPWRRQAMQTFFQCTKKRHWFPVTGMSFHVTHVYSNN